ncbi:hypothetical protein CTAM01_00572 [Colletotrichum tamarilloi]|uniref:Uncharacterized protein n=1 Tax=Colletotrichum tamarilloi TaxID=1209934 RepID=A0ABQ9RUZ0_9PEZI|nr:uncharacterized protein CTAM01_00572 [Colletotrichum tamarilloi]KAK1513176.1 hypothetical protein CTAM01_00572 [Colletotrichum tamarilloi]
MKESNHDARHLWYLSTRVGGMPPEVLSVVCLGSATTQGGQNEGFELNHPIHMRSTSWIFCKVIIRIWRCALPPLSCRLSHSWHLSARRALSRRPPHRWPYPRFSRQDRRRAGNAIIELSRPQHPYVPWTRLLAVKLNEKETVKDLLQRGHFSAKPVCWATARITFPPEALSLSQKFRDSVSRICSGCVTHGPESLGKARGRFGFVCEPSTSGGKKPPS